MDSYFWQYECEYLLIKLLQKYILKKFDLLQWDLCSCLCISNIPDGSYSNRKELAMRVILMVSMMVSMFGVVGCKDESASSGGDAVPAATQPAATQPAATQPAAKVDLAKDDAVAVNKLCPIMGNPVNADGVKVVYEGKVYGFCCADCVEPFKKDPQKAIASMQAGH